MASAAAITPIGEIPALVASVRAAYASGATLPYSWRAAQLSAIIRLLEENRPAIHAALAADLHKPLFEADINEIEVVVQEARHALSHLASWMAPQAVPTPLMHLPASASMRREPLGVALLILPWNFPFYLTLNSLVAALSAGNAVVLKLSELAPASEALLCSLLARYLDASAVRCVCGGVPQATAVLAERFDIIMYTGGPAVARIVMAAAARHLTPVLLELGGKNPVIVDASANLDAAARAILRGRCVNAGQMCTAPEYVLVEAAVEGRLLERLQAAAARMFGEDAKASPSFGRIVSAGHWRRVAGLLEGAEKAGARALVGGSAAADEATLYIPPTVLREPPASAAIWREEVFGPVLCTRRVASVEEAIAIVNAGDKPLCLYMFSTDARAIESVMARTSAGGVTVNDTMVHATLADLPFGGVGLSGMGAYHGKHGFDAFSHAKPVLHFSSLLNLTGAFLDPPYAPGQERTLGALLRYVPSHLPGSLKDAILAGLLAAVVGMGLKLSGRI